MQGNILEKSSGSKIKTPFPIYQQLTEPFKKEGIWVKINEEIQNIYLQPYLPNKYTH